MGKDIYEAIKPDQTKVKVKKPRKPINKDSLIIGIVIAVIVFFALRHVFKMRKSGCSCCCAACGGGCGMSQKKKSDNDLFLVLLLNFVYNVVGNINRR